MLLPMVLIHWTNCMNSSVFSEVPCVQRNLRVAVAVVRK